MADFDFSTLVTDRSASDLELLRDLLSTPMSDWTAEHLAEFNRAISKGAYNYTDLNRVTACMEYLDEVLRAYGYRTGYQRIVVHPEEPPGPVGPLPEGYTELSYLYSTGAAYINTGISGVFKANFDIKFDPSGTRVLMGQGTGTGQYWGKDASNQPELGGGITISSDLTQRSTVTFEKTSSAAILTANNTTVQRASATTTSPFLLFRTGGRDWASYSGGIALYSCSFEQNGQQVLDLVPCENPDGELGFFDLINEEFYGNAGTGAFIAGPEVPAPEPEPTLDPYTWYEADIPTVSTMEAYLGNVSALRSVLTLPEDTAQAPGDMAGLTPTEANRIEEILSVIHSYLEAMITVFRRCGAAICGGPGFYFLN